MSQHTAGLGILLLLVIVASAWTLLRRSLISRRKSLLSRLEKLQQLEDPVLHNSVAHRIASKEADKPIDVDRERWRSETTDDGPDEEQMQQDLNDLRDYPKIIRSVRKRSYGQARHPVKESRQPTEEERRIQYERSLANLRTSHQQRLDELRGIRVKVESLVIATSKASLLQIGSLEDQVRTLEAAALHCASMSGMVP